MNKFGTTVKKIMHSKTQLKTILLAAAMALTLILGLWLLLAPTIDHQTLLNRQNALLAELEAAPVAEPSDPVIVPMTGPEASLPNLSLEEQPTAPTAAPSDPFAGIGVLAIDKISLKLPVVEGVTVAQLKVAAGHVPQTPAIGAVGNAVIAGHRNYSYGSMFNRLGELAVGDEITYTPRGTQPMRFMVFEITEIMPCDQIAFIQPTDEAIITLYTCTPVRVATHRLLIRAQLLGD